MAPAPTRPDDIAPESPVLVAGAGPTGLTAALELARRDIPVRIIERTEGPSPLSRAVGIMPWAMDILDVSGAGQPVRARSQPTRRVEVFSGGRRMLCVAMDVDPDPQVRLFCLPQNETETILAERLAHHGVKVEYSRSLEAIEEDGERPVATVGGERHPCAYILGADGVRSTVRRHLGEEFAGHDLPSRWSIADVESSNWSEPGVFQVYLTRSGDAVFVIPIGPTRYRLVASQPDALATLPVTMPVDHVHRTGDFTIGIRQAAGYGRSRVWIAGDAAHTHSPVGGRGMNLGIQDAQEWVRRLSEGLLEPGADEGYSASRHARGREIIEFTETARRAVTSPSTRRRTLALRTLGVLLRLPTVDRRIVRRMLTT